jgi:hypothetical protein
MDVKRRGFFGVLLAAGPAAAVDLLAEAPEPESVRPIELSANYAYVIEFSERLTDKGVEDVRKSWNAALGPNAPRVVVLCGGATVKTLELQPKV